MTLSQGRGEPPRSRPLSPFASPFHARGHVDQETQMRIDAFKSQYDNTHDEPVPSLVTNPVWNLADVIGDAATVAVQNTGRLQFQSVGDTGFDSYPLNERTGDVRWDKPNLQFETALGNLVAHMAKEVDPGRVERGPAFLLLLGDVNYFDNTRSGYAQQFYEPFAAYPRKIIAIPGNHDMEVKISQQVAPCQAFLENFCQARPGIPPAARGAFPPREMAAQPGVYWRLDAPYVQIIGLCSNIGETTGGVLRSQYAGHEQYDWFVSTLKEVRAGHDRAGDDRPALVIAVHHPPYTFGSHSPSVQMNKDLDAAFDSAGVWPDLVLAAHDHLYQRFTRTHKLNGQRIEIPYVVPGGGGRFHSQPKERNSDVPQPEPGVEQEAVGAGNGYVTVTAMPNKLRVDYRPTDHFEQNSAETIDVDLVRRLVRR